MAIFLGHTHCVTSIAFSSNGTSLVSGADDKTIRLWDVQTGGVIKSFHHDGRVSSVSVSADCSIVASGTENGAAHLWDVQTGESKCVIVQQNQVRHIIFAGNLQHFTFISGGKVQQWNLNGCKIGPTYDGSHISFSSHHTWFALCHGKVVTVQSSDPEVTVAEFHVNSTATYCCFSPDSRLVGAVAGYAIYVWDIISSEPHLVETFVGHGEKITSLAFLAPSTLVSSSWDKSAKFWQIEMLSTDSVVVDPKSTPSTSASIKSVSIQVNNGVAISSDLCGVVKTWDIFTGLCKASFQTPAQDYGYSDVQLVDGRLVFIWSGYLKIYIWDSQTNTLETLDTPYCSGLRISKDGSKVFFLSGKSIQAWSMWSWEPVGTVETEKDELPSLNPLHTDGSKIWIRFNGLSQGWDFGISGTSPVQLPIASTEKPCLDLIYDSLWEWGGVTRVEDTRTGKEVFRLSGRYTGPKDMQWDGQYLVAGYESGEMLILDFHHSNFQ